MRTCEKVMISEFQQLHFTCNYVLLIYQSCHVTSHKTPKSSHSSSSLSNSDESSSDEFTIEYATPRTNKQCKRTVITPKVSAVLDRTNTSVRTATMILASVVNEVGCSISSAILSKSIIHPQRLKYCCEAATKITDDFRPIKAVGHWDDKLLPDLTGTDTDQVDRLPVLISSLVDGSKQL
jgi:hypothetical protein